MVTDEMCEFDLIDKVMAREEKSKIDLKKRLTSAICFPQNLICRMKERYPKIESLGEEKLVPKRWPQERQVRRKKCTTCLTWIRPCIRSAVIPGVIRTRDAARDKARYTSCSTWPDSTLDTHFNRMHAQESAAFKHVRNCTSLQKLGH